MQKPFLLISLGALSLTAILYWKTWAQQPPSTANPQTTHTQTASQPEAEIQILHRSTGTLQKQPVREGLASRIMAKAQEQLELQITASWQPNRPVHIETPHGGAFNGNPQPLHWTPRASQETLKLNYQLGSTLGKYLVTLRQGQTQQTIEFWVGQPNPMGEAGPALRFQSQ